MQLKLKQSELNKRFIFALKDLVISHNDVNKKPLEVDLKLPLPRKIRVYIFNTTYPPGGRSLGEHKIQLIVPGQDRGQRGSFDHSDGRIVLLCGYQPELDVFILWDASLYHEFAFSRNVQVKAETIIEGFAGKIGRQQRRIRHGGSIKNEIVLTAKAGLLSEAILLRISLTLNKLINS